MFVTNLHWVDHKKVLKGNFEKVGRFWLAYWQTLITRLLNALVFVVQNPWHPLNLHGQCIVYSIWLLPDALIEPLHVLDEEGWNLVGHHGVDQGLGGLLGWGWLWEVEGLVTWDLSAPSTANLTVSLFLCGSGSCMPGEVESPWRMLCQLKRPSLGLGQRQESCWQEWKRAMSSL